jgi:hypothetical protein
VVNAPLQCLEKKLLKSDRYCGINIESKHRVSGLSCTRSFDMGLTSAEDKRLKSFNDAQTIF